ncbi:uncharacterized protein ARMOST_15170 [Armillaria ostoyae]|uniref:Uncharacterized protein n=1 Tax=Armillaria ostoyae TaxID=47428 RepID=A0A284RSM0_ARMOS|nr:uncharacterized protein ARMOST_15170 [Armillaria ostoyae]
MKPTILSCPAPFSNEEAACEFESIATAITATLFFQALGPLLLPSATSNTCQGPWTLDGGEGLRESSWQNSAEGNRCNGMDNRHATVDAFCSGVIPITIALVFTPPLQGLFPSSFSHRTTHECMGTVGSRDPQVTTFSSLAQDVVDAPYSATLMAHIHLSGQEYAAKKMYLLKKYTVRMATARRTPTSSFIHVLPVWRIIILLSSQTSEHVLTAQDPTLFTRGTYLISSQRISPNTRTSQSLLSNVVGRREHGDSTARKTRAYRTWYHFPPRRQFHNSLANDAYATQSESIHLAGFIKEDSSHSPEKRASTLTGRRKYDRIHSGTSKKNRETKHVAWLGGIATTL